ncbi:hypothetical protein KR084_007581, partial [Drosophila pseudotakahashii]
FLRKIMSSGEGSKKASLGGQTYVVEKFMGKRFIFTNGRYRPQYLAKWEEFPSEESTWEPLENLANCIGLIADFEAELFRGNQEKKKTQ